MSTISILDFGVCGDCKSDTTPAVRSAIAALSASGGGRLTFPKGQYHFRPDRAIERFLFFSNNDESLKRIAFPLFDVSNIEIDGEGSEFVFHDSIVPFAILNSTDITLSNLTIDWERPFHSEVEVLAVSDVLENGFASVDVRIPDAYPYTVENERLLFVGEDGTKMPMANSLEFDPVRRETAFRVHDNYELRVNHRATEMNHGIVRLAGRFGSVPTPGNVLVIAHTGRINPGIGIADSKRVTISDVTIHHAGAMGVIAQRTENIRAERLSVTPAYHKGRIASATADATHFVNCKGHIELIDCLFEGQMDDPTNVHGIYARISEVIDRHTIEVELVHGQQLGIDITQAGDRIEFVRQTDLGTFHEADVVSVDRINKKYSVIRVTEKLSSEVKVGDAVASMGWVADVTIRGCTTRNNRARGFLISTPGKVVIENNHFHNPGAAILIAGDANYWFESGAVKDVAIVNNHFDNCLFGNWGRAIIDVNPEIESEHRRHSNYHRNIRIENNTFDAFDLRILKAHCVDHLTVKGNIIRGSNAYVDQPVPNEMFSVSNCDHVVIEDNAFVEVAEPGNLPCA